MIAATQSEGSAYHRSSLPHASTTSSVTSSEQWTSARSSASATPTLIQPPPTSARGATPTTTVFRHHPSSSTSSSASHSSAPIHTHQQHPHPEQPHPTSTPATPSPRSRQSPARSGRRSEDSAPVILQNLSQVVELPREEPLLHSPSRRNRSGEEDRKRYEISGMPVTDVIEMVAGLLTKITTTNDQQHSQMHRNIPPPESSGMSNTTNSVLAFHGKNVPSITILSYLSRIHKYCPTTYEVFLSLLVYFDRMTERVNRNPPLNWKGGSTVSNGELGSPGVIASDPYNFSHFFVVDSFNIHRLVIAGVTCASKFFSDVFYTNSRYAKVGGLPLQELNHLELQFLILNDFRLAVPVEELEAYGTMLVQFYAREAVSNADLRGIGPPADPAAN
ncbi:cyclin-domain-containing protein [Morchella snyderi]|nr:cyclin-domain-containing protein [Morchella snyderi]